MLCSDNGKEILSMNEVLSYLLRSSEPLIKKKDLEDLASFSKPEWENMVDRVRGMIVTYPGKVQNTMCYVVFYHFQITVLLIETIKWCR